MRILVSIMVSAVLVGITSCSTKPQIVGKWDCKTDKVTYAEGQSDKYEYTSDGTQIIKIAEGKSQPVEITGIWKVIDDNRFASTFDSKTSVREYKFEGEKLLFKSSSDDAYPIKCDRAR